MDDNKRKSAGLELFEKFLEHIDLDILGEEQIISTPDNEVPTEEDIAHLLHHKAMEQVFNLHMGILDKWRENPDVENPFREEFDGLAYEQVEEFAKLLGALLRQSLVGTKVSWETVAQVCIAYTWLAISKFNEGPNDKNNNSRTPA